MTSHGTRRRRLFPAAPAVVAAAFLACPAGAQLQVFDWQLSSPSGTGGGSVDYDTLTITGPDGAHCPGGSINSCTAVAPYDLIVVANYVHWNYDKYGSGYDPFVTLIDGIDTKVADGCTVSCELALSVPAGAVFGFGVKSLDCLDGPAVLTLTNFHVEPAKPVVSVVGQQGGERFGTVVARMGDLDADGRAEVLIGAPFVDLAGTDVGRVAVCSSQSGQVLLAIDGLAPGEQFGTAVAAGDVDGDGLDDLVVGAPFAKKGLYVPGAVRIYSGADGHLLRDWAGPKGEDQFGAAVAVAGDFNLDGFADVLVGAPLHDNVGVANAGMVRLFSGADGSTLASWAGGASGDELGRAVAAVGDLDGDGVTEIIAGAPRADELGLDSGQARVFAGGTGALLYTLVSDCPGKAVEALFGSAVAGVGDVDADGTFDMAVGAPGPPCASTPDAQPRGVMCVFAGRDGRLLFKVTGPDLRDVFGYAVGAAGDVDGDGRPDIVVGSPQVPTGAGKARVYDAEAGAPIQASVGKIGERYGEAVAGLGDIDLDGLCDLAVGAPGHDEAVTDVGQASFVPSAVLWAALGSGLAGSQSVPQLAGTGLLAGGKLTVALGEAPPSSPVFLFVGLSELDAPLLGGVLVPHPDALFTAVTDPDGTYHLQYAATGPLPPGQSFWFQAWIADSGGPAGYAASWGLRATVP